MICQNDPPSDDPNALLSATMGILDPFFQCGYTFKRHAIIFNLIRNATYVLTFNKQNMGTQF